MWKLLRNCSSVCDVRGIERFSPPCFSVLKHQLISWLLEPLRSHPHNERKPKYPQRSLSQVIVFLLPSFGNFFCILYHKHRTCLPFSLKWKRWTCSCALFVERNQKWMQINPLTSRCKQKWISGHAHIWEIFTWGHMGLCAFPITSDGSQRRAPSPRHWLVFGT